MSLTQQQQDAAARRQLRERGVSEERILDLDYSTIHHVAWQRKVARGGLSTFIDNMLARARRTDNTTPKEGRQ